MIAIIDYGAGNLRSVAKALERLGASCQVTSEPKQVLEAQAVLFPGVGAAAEAMLKLREAGLVEPLRQLVAEGRPIFAVCLGLQVLLSFSEEGGWHPCLDIIPGTVRRLPANGLKVPHMGWNQVWQKADHPLFEGIPDGADFYFVHSYYADPEDASVVAAVTEYSIPFCSVAIRGNLVATQFHPEKSGAVGLKMYENFLRWAGVLGRAQDDV